MSRNEYLGDRQISSERALEGPSSLLYTLSRVILPSAKIVVNVISNPSRYRRIKYHLIGQNKAPQKLGTIDQDG